MGVLIYQPLPTPHKSKTHTQKDMFAHKYIERKYDVYVHTYDCMCIFYRSGHEHVHGYVVSKCHWRLIKYGCCFSIARAVGTRNICGLRIGCIWIDLKRSTRRKQTCMVRPFSRLTSWYVSLCIRISPDCCRIWYIYVYIYIYIYIHIYIYAERLVHIDWYKYTTWTYIYNYIYREVSGKWHLLHRYGLVLPNGDVCFLKRPVTKIWCCQSRGIWVCPNTPSYLLPSYYMFYMLRNQFVT